MEERQAFNLVSPKFRQNKGSMRLGPWKCCVCSRVVEDCPQSDSFKKYFACSIGNHFAILNSSKRHGAWWEWLDMAQFFVLMSWFQSGIAERCSLYKHKKFFKLVSLSSQHCHDCAFRAEVGLFKRFSA